MNTGNQLPALENYQSPQDSGFNVKDIIFKYLHYWWLFLITLALSLTVVWIYLRYSKSKYSVSSTLLIRNEGSNRTAGMGTENMFADIALFQSSSNKQNEIEILRSRTLMERVVRNLDLTRSYNVIGKVKTTNIYPDSPFEVRVINLSDSSASFSFPITFDPKFTSFKIGEDSPRYEYGQIIKNSFGTFIITKKDNKYYYDFQNFQFAYQPDVVAAINFGSALQVQPTNENSNVLQLTYITENPKLGADILNNLMEAYNDATVEDKNEINRKIISFIDDRLELVESQLDSVEDDLQYFKTNQNIIDITSQSQQYFNSLSDLEKSIREQEVQLQIAELLKQYFTKPENRNSLVPTTLGLNDPSLLGYVNSYNELVLERTKQLQSGATAQNPIVINLEKNIEEARLRMLQTLGNIQNAYKTTISSLNRQNELIKGQIASIPAKEKQGRDRSRQQEIKQNLYLYLLQKKEESAIAEASTISSSRVIDNAKNIPTLIGPIPFRLYGFALLAGIFLPILIIYLIDLLNDRVTTRSDITKITKAPIIGEIGHNDDEEMLVFPNKSRTIIAEQFRILRSNLNYIITDNSKKPVILVTSSFSGEGKSFISTNLAAALAVSGKKTVVLEFDLRKPKIISGLGLKKSSGLTNYLIGGIDVHDLPQRISEVEELYVIGSGPIPPNPSEILLLPKMNELFAYLNKEFDAIVIDTAPIGLVSDAATLSNFANSTLYVVRQRHTYKKQLLFFNELFGQGKMPKLSLVVNDVLTEGSRSYYGYGGGKYGYGYGYGLGESEGYFQKNKKKRKS
jgi:capsular exopolysaccharide synthesis family protein